MNIFKKDFDKTNAIIAFGVFLVSFIVYALTVQRSFSFWDCGEFVASSYILGIPHPPGTPLFILLGRLMSIIPFVEDISYRINYLSVITSSFTAMISYLITVKIVSYFFKYNNDKSFGKLISYIGGIAGGFFVAFGRTNWSNSVEAEVYGLALALSVLIIYLTIHFFEIRNSLNAKKIMIMVFYLGLLGIGAHMTVYLVMPVCAIFFILKGDTTKKDWLYVCGFFIIEILMILLFSNGLGAGLFKMFSVGLGLGLVLLLYKKIDWPILIAVVSVSSVMMSFSLYFKITLISIVIIILMALLAKKRNIIFDWKTALMIILVGVIGISIHLYVPIRSELNPRIDENNPSRSWQTFVDFLDRKQYGQTSMIDRMFNRRGSFENQFGRHPNMGFWSYFEEQYSSGGWNFILPFFILGIIGMVTAIKKRLEIGLPFMTIFILSSIGLILYMNFADGTKYDFATSDAYLEVRNRDYFFTPAFVLFGIAMGIGVSTVMMYLRDKFSQNVNLKKIIVYSSTILVLLPSFSLAHNYNANDRSKNNIPYVYAKNILDSCEQNAILFTAGDNDTFPLWCIQEVYNYRKDVVVVNLSLLNTDWYVEQMKNRYNVPISLTDEQILWYPYEFRPGRFGYRPKVPFNDRPRKRKTFLNPNGFGGKLVRVQDMMVDEIVIENKWRRPIHFISTPYAESPLNLRDHIVTTGLVHTLVADPQTSVDVNKGYDLYMNTYSYDGFGDGKIYRDDNATGVFIGVGINGVRLFDELIREGDTTRAMDIANKLMNDYPEYWQIYTIVAGMYDQLGDSTKAEETLVRLRDTLTDFRKYNSENLFYLQDLGLVTVLLGQRLNDQAQIDEGLTMLWQAFDANANSSYAFRKLITVLSQLERYTDMNIAAKKFAEYKINLTDPLVQRLLGIAPQGAIDQ